MAYFFTFMKEKPLDESVKPIINFGYCTSDKNTNLYCEYNFIEDIPLPPGEELLYFGDAIKRFSNMNFRRDVYDDDELKEFIKYIYINIHFNDKNLEEGVLENKFANNFDRYLLNIKNLYSKITKTSDKNYSV